MVGLFLLSLLALEGDFACFVAAPLLTDVVFWGDVFCGVVLLLLTELILILLMDWLTVFSLSDCLFFSM
jgi:hypothetical protein